MDLSNISVIKSLLLKHGFKFSKSLGQNFLINSKVCPLMAQSCIPKNDFGVIEIGAGIGVLTKELAKRAEKVVSVELDKKLFPILNETLEEFNNVKLINENIINLDLKGLIKKEFPNMNVSVCANLPYYITSPIIMKLLEDRLPLSNITVMIQKEAANRICALPKTREVGAISISVRYYSIPEMLFNVSKKSFIPAPKVDSSVVKLTIRKSPLVSVKNEKIFFKVVKASFAQRRKTLVNSLSSGLSISKDKVTKVLSSLNIKEKSRPEELSIEDFAKISDSI